MKSTNVTFYKKSEFVQLKKHCKSLSLFFLNILFISCHEMTKKIKNFSDQPVLVRLSVFLQMVGFLVIA